jgi:hypothetical protein
MLIGCKYDIGERPTIELMPALKGNPFFAIDDGNTKSFAYFFKKQQSFQGDCR